MIISDSTMSETTTLLKAGATDLVLRLAEAAATMPDLTLDNPVQAIGAVSRDITGRTRLRLANGRVMTALEIQREYRQEHGLPLSAPQAAQADLAYHDVHRGRGRYYQLQRSGAVDGTARDVDIFEAKTVPPAPGRHREAG